MFVISNPSNIMAQTKSPRRIAPRGPNRTLSMMLFCQCFARRVKLTRDSRPLPSGVPKQKHREKRGREQRQPDQRNNNRGEMPIYVAASGPHCCLSAAVMRDNSAVLVGFTVRTAVAAAVAFAIVAVMVMMDTARARLRNRVGSQGRREQECNCRRRHRRELAAGLQELPTVVVLVWHGVLQMVKAIK